MKKARKSILAERMVFFRAIHGLTQAEFGKKCGLSAIAIHNIEKGSNPSSRSRIRIEYVLEGGNLNEVINKQDKSVQELPQSISAEVCGTTDADTESGSVGDGQ